MESRRRCWSRTSSTAVFPACKTAHIILMSSEISSITLWERVAISCLTPVSRAVRNERSASARPAMRSVSRPSRISAAISMVLRSWLSSSASGSSLSEPAFAASMRGGQLASMSAKSSAEQPRLTSSSLRSSRNVRFASSPAALCSALHHATAGWVRFVLSRASTSANSLSASL